MGITAHVNYSNRALQAFKLGSLLAGRLSQDYRFGDFKSVVISTIITTPYGDYTRSGTSRYGTPTEVEDETQELICTQDKAFSKTIDKGNAKDQQYLKKAGRVVALMLKEQGIPMTDLYGFRTLAAKAGKIVGSGTALSKSNICDRISDGTVYLDDQEVPADGRTLFVTPAGYKLLRMSDEFIKVESLAQKSLAQGKVGEYDNMDVVKVPGSRWPANVNFMIVHKSAACLPMKIEETKIHQDPPGISGNLLEGRQYYDCFVFGRRSAGIYVDVDTSSGKGSVLSAPTVAADGTVTQADAVLIQYTTDGSDPRYSTTAKIVATGAKAVHAAGDTIRAVALGGQSGTADGSFSSPVAEKKATS